MVRFFYPKEKGDYIRGVVVDYDFEDKYGNKLIVLNTNLHNDEWNLWALPAHTSLKYQCKYVVKDDILKITYNGKKMTENYRKMHDYKVEHIPCWSIGWYLEMGIKPNWEWY